MVGSVIMFDPTDISSSYPVWAKIAVVVLGACLFFILLFARQKTEPGKLVIDDIIHGSFPPRIDFRIRNTGGTTAAVSKVLFKVLKMKMAVSMVAKQKPSDQGTLLLGPDVKEGDVLEVPVAVKVAGMDTDRILIDFSWNQSQPEIGYFYCVIPVLKTSSGFVQGKSLMLHIQQDFSHPKGKSHPDANSSPPFWGDNEGEGIKYEWPVEEKRARQVRHAAK